MKKPTYYLRNQGTDILKILQNRGIPHTVKYTNATRIISTETKRYVVSPKRLKFKDFQFIQKVKKCALECEKPAFPSDLKPSYYKYMNTKTGLYEDVTEVDVSAAYWTLAYRLGYLTDEIYQLGTTVPKFTRLIGWGAIASNPISYQFNGEKYIKIGSPPDEDHQRTRSYFFAVAYELDEIMKEAIGENREDIFFYWVDAFFIRKSKPLKEKIAQAMEKNGLQVHEKPLWWARISKVNEYLKKIDVMEEGGREKTFLQKTGNRQAYQLKKFMQMLDATSL